MKLVERVGRRGALLLFLALLDVIYAVGLYQPLDETKRSPSTLFLQHILPLPVWATIWLVVGIVCFAGAFVRQDRWAYACAVGLKTLWGTVALLGWIVAGVDRSWLSAAIWLAFAGIVLMISAWPEPPKDLFPQGGLMDTGVAIALVSLAGTAITIIASYRSSTKANSTNDRKVDLDVHKDAIAALKEIIAEQDKHVDRVKKSMEEVQLQLAREQDVSATLRAQLRQLQEQVDELTHSRARLERALAAQGIKGN